MTQALLVRSSGKGESPTPQRSTSASRRPADKSRPHPTSRPQRPELADRDLVVRARNGDAAAREDLAARCGRACYAFALQLTGDPDRAADVAQDCLLRFFKSLSRFDPERPVVPWLFQIVRNRVRDLNRRARPRAALEHAALLDDLPRQPRDLAPTPDQRAQRRELRHLMWRCLTTLADGDREILVLRDYQDLSYREIAAVLEVPIGTVMSRLHTARRRLREAVVATGYDFGVDA
ncbi:MAG: sigma-70 family RNA polymerase sigma factor [Thermoanaerobaculia bacterium]|nr:sigma-70 family RNA polymerase sigma factor [Thermoanaerobaculia bacterium]